jgi:hypothetical protein
MLRGLVTYYVLFFIHLESRRVDIAGITVHPNEAWMKQIARNATMDDCGALRDCRYLLHDRDTKFTRSFRAILVSSCAFRRLRPLIPVDRDHLFRSIATSVARVLLAPLDVAVDVSVPRAGQARQDSVPVASRRDPRATRSSLTADAAARAGGPC